MSPICLVKKRERPRFISKRWFVVYIKRLITFPALVKIFLASWRARLFGAEIGEMVVIESSALNGKISNLEIGDETYIGRTVNFALHAKIKIGSRVVINNGVQLLTAGHETNDLSWTGYSRPITIEDYAWIATNAILLPGVNIGRGAVVGAGAVVTKNVSANEVVAGNPAVVVSKRCECLSYNPVILCAPFEAWIGKGGG